MYSYEDRMRAVELYMKLGNRARWHAMRGEDVRMPEGIHMMLLGCLARLRWLVLTPVSIAFPRHATPHRYGPEKRRISDNCAGRDRCVRLADG